jgi:hypothetical protein
MKIFEYDNWFKIFWALICFLPPLYFLNDYIFSIYFSQEKSLDLLKFFIIVMIVNTHFGYEEMSFEQDTLTIFYPFRIIKKQVLIDLRTITKVKMYRSVYISPGYLMFKFEKKRIFRWKLILLYSLTYDEILKLNDIIKNYCDDIYYKKD